jgi:hypothetical protein
MAFCPIPVRIAQKKTVPHMKAIPKSAIWWHHSCSRICFQQIRNAIPTWDAHMACSIVEACLHENSKGFLQFTILFQIAQKQQFHNKQKLMWPKEHPCVMEQQKRS